jgi:hypothetical protein
VCQAREPKALWYAQVLERLPGAVEDRNVYPQERLDGVAIPAHGLSLGQTSADDPVDPRFGHGLELPWRKRSALPESGWVLAVGGRGRIARLPHLKRDKLEVRWRNGKATLAQTVFGQPDAG